ncbi:3-oxoacyl-[acyl-carrier protein] reductase [Gemmobacter megaterium]|uniref:3-oxoacyl-[acyl-carrier protein] reductase n=1 Tax=Gemmobacter megaterium TaxID=1086013 RepID=A0A1N7PBD4_9RHOB|nr:SDR family oxidoreductase [Gemmobacter megaterium]GGE19256.1 3-ketoacyl-ACP reductase [Gemmobacter megaterium]SIT07904.1 3-oxoacyl-[acyl-carrier protein] reductase [Gemmobacter megaterium]
MTTTKGRMDGKIAIVTGAGGGFGEGIAKLFAAEGARVGVLDLRADAAERVAAEIGANAVALAADVTSRPQMEAAVAKVSETFGAPNVLVNNAGWTHRNKPMLEVTEDEFDRVYAINVKSIYIASQIIVPIMRGLGGGAIVNIGSVAGIRPRPGLTWYNSTKGAVNIMSQSMAVELAPDNIRVNAICPVMGETGLLEAFMGVPDTPENRARFVATIPMGRMSRPEDIARATLYLASDDAEFITGVLFPVDGGRTI